MSNSLEFSGSIAFRQSLVACSGQVDSNEQYLFTGVMDLKKIAVIQDLSGLGKCSLTAAIPVISVMGVQAVPLPTAVLSNPDWLPSYLCL